jgi:hypothetical protein
MDEQKTAAAPRCTEEQLVGPDSRLVYIVVHVLAWTFNAAMLAVLVWLAHDLRSAWPLAAMMFVRGYHHDFNRVRVQRPNAEHEPRRGAP